MKIWSLLTNCLDDYTVDSRGDVGSWIRMAACESLVPAFKHVSQQDVKVTIGKLLRLSVEKMDRVRTVAGNTLCLLVPQWTDAEDGLKEFVEGYIRHGTLIMIGWKAMSSPFLRNCILLQCNCYHLSRIERRY